jgi:predicted alpha/beta-fold hydrolase
MTHFRPLPFLGNPHVQTLLGNLLSGPALHHPTQPRQVVLPDGDRLLLHDNRPERWRPGGRVALLVHGLGGSHCSGYLQRLARLLLRRRVRVVRMDLRGCGRGMALARRAYHGGCSDDVRAAAAEVHRWSPTSPLALVGFSLGGNIVLKLAGEAAADPVPGLERVAAVAPPVDMVRCAATLALPRNRFYDRYFARSLAQQVRRRRHFFPDQPGVRFPRGLTLRQFDELYTAPRNGFADALDYYQRASALPLLPRIAVPAFVLTARDDPFIVTEPLEACAAFPPFEVRVLERGGHLGYLGWDGAGGIRWAEARVAEWVVRPDPRSPTGRPGQP